MLGGEQIEIGIHVIDVAAVDADRGEQAGVLPGAGEIDANVAVVEEDGPPSVAALDRAVQVVPFVGPADRGGRGLRFDGGDGLFGGDLFQEVKDGVQLGRGRGTGDQQIRDTGLRGNVADSDPIAFRRQHHPGHGFTCEQVFLCWGKTQDDPSLLRPIRVTDDGEVPAKHRREPTP